MTDLTNELKGAHVEFLFSQKLSSTNKPADKIEIMAGDPISLSFIQSQDDWKGAHGKIANTGTTVTLNGRFLDYVPGYVSICGAGQETVLSGPFSGCWYIRFFDAGQYHVAHVGTTGTQETNVAVKRAFGEYAKSLTDLHQATFYKPNRAWSDEEIREFMKGFGGKTRPIYILSSLESDGDCHSICLGRTESSEKMLKMKVRGDGRFKLPQKYGSSKPAFQDKWTKKDSHDRHVTGVSIVTQYEILDIVKLEPQRWSEIKDKEFLK